MYIKRIPTILSLTMGILASIICYSKGMETKDIYLYISLFIIVFYLTGSFISKQLTGLMEDVKKKALQEKLKEKQNGQKQDEMKGQSIDYKVEDE